jgi:uncharacterized protein (TIGR00645 family)
MSDDKPLLKTIEDWLESMLFASRWLLAPLYLGLALSLIVLLIKFVGELVHMAGHAFTATESEVILGVLSLVDLCLTGSLIVIVIFSGYENFVSRIDHGNHTDWPEWMGKIDFSGLKLKLLSSIVAISAIQLLKQFMALDKVSDRDIMWMVIVHVVFVVSSVFLALSDRLAVHGGGHAKKSGGGNGGDHTPEPDGERLSDAASTAGGVHAHAAPANAHPVRAASQSKVPITRPQETPRSSAKLRGDDCSSKADAATSLVDVEDDDLVSAERSMSIKRRVH